MIALEQAIRYCSDLGLIVEFNNRSVMLYRSPETFWFDEESICGECSSLEEAVEEAARRRGDTAWL